MRQLIDVVHLLICSHPHEYDPMQVVHRQDGVCYYYIENDMAEGLSLPDHQSWSEITEKLKTSLSLSSDQEAMNFIRSAVRISQELRELVGDNEDRLTFIRGLFI